MKDDFDFRLNYHGVTYFFTLLGDHKFQEEADTAPLEICLAALKLKGIEIDPSKIQD